MKAYFLSTSDGNARWMVNGCHGPRQGTKPASGKSENCSSSSSSSSYSRKKVISRQLIHGCRYCCINHTNELRLLMSMCFWVKKESEGGQIRSKNNSKRARTSVFIFPQQPLDHTDNWIASF